MHWKQSYVFTCPCHAEIHVACLGPLPTSPTHLMRSQNRVYISKSMCLGDWNRGACLGLYLDRFNHSDMIICHFSALTCRLVFPSRYLVTVSQAWRQNKAPSSSVSTVFRDTVMGPPACPLSSASAKCYECRGRKQRIMCFRYLISHNKSNSDGNSYCAPIFRYECLWLGNHVTFENTDCYCNSNSYEYDFITQCDVRHPNMVLIINLVYRTSNICFS